MSPRKKLFFLLFCIFTFSCIAHAAPDTTLMVEAESFQFAGDWKINRDAQAMGREILLSGGGNADAMTVISVPQSGIYNVWVRSKDFNEQPGTRRYQVGLDDGLFPKELGAHGFDGWEWEKAGQRTITAGDHVLAIHDVTLFYGRCDAIILTTSTNDPNAQEMAALAKFRIKPKIENNSTQNTAKFAQQPVISTDNLRQVAQLENKQVRVRFLQSHDSNNRPVIVRETEINVNGQWQKLPVAPGQENFFLLYTPQTDVRPGVIPSWKTDSFPYIKHEFEVAGKKYSVSEPVTGPFFAAPSQAIIGRSAVQKSANSVEVQYQTSTGLRIIGDWSLAPDSYDLSFSMNFTAPRDGYYSFGYSAFTPWEKKVLSFDLLPPLFQYQRLPEHAVLLTDTVTPQPMALAQIGDYSYAVLADPDKLPFEWPTSTNASYGFSLLNADDKVQPTIFGPVLGFPKSLMKAGETKNIDWRVLAYPGDWKQTLEYASNTIFKVTDYRKPYKTSLTGAALNMIDLIKNADASGWNARLKGFYNIEADNVASQSSPLTLVSAALLTRDENFYRTRALPTIEYTLSRRGAHFATEVPQTKTYVNEQDTKITVPSEFYGTAYWEGLYDLLHQANPWIAKIAMPDNEVRYRTSYSAMPHWSELMGAYRLHPSAALLDDIKKEADQFLQDDVYGKKEKFLGTSPFYNVSNYPYWWDLLDLYDITHDRKYLDAAQQGAFLTIAGLWSHPRVPDGDITIHPNGEFLGLTHLWWKGGEHYRLGNPRKPGDTPAKKVPAWLVAQMGLGLEQPSTYFAGGNSGLQNIMNSAWAANLLRLYHDTGNDIFRIYARNTIISRFSNYPGYYLNGFTDLELQPDYPYKGPDVTSIYYHHIPVQLAFTLDFLVTEAVTRAQGKIDFPWVKQQGYVWFTNRIYGDRPGHIFDDDTARLWLDRQLIQVRSPAVNYLMARGDHRVWLILMNEADSVTQTPVDLNADALELTGNSYQQYDAAGKSTLMPRSDHLTVSVPAKGLIALAFPAREKKQTPIPPLQNGRASVKLPGDWGTAEAFRIRSPFGEDSLYVVLTGRPTAGAEATLQMDGADPVTAKVYPYEFTIYPWAMDREMKFTLRLKTADGQVTGTQPVVLSGENE
jgi:hypothetical protein